jgi:hypothetical protein
MDAAMPEPSTDGSPTVGATKSGVKCWLSQWREQFPRPPRRTRDDNVKHWMATLKNYRKAASGARNLLLLFVPPDERGAR